MTSWLGEATAGNARRLIADAKIAGYATPEGAVHGFMHRVQYRRNQELLLETLPPFSRVLAAGREWLDADEVSEILDACTSRESQDAAALR